MVITLEHIPRYTFSDLPVERIGYLKHKDFAITPQIQFTVVSFCAFGEWHIRTKW